MENLEIARVLMEYADLLEISGGNFFQVRSYRDAARTLSDLSRPITQILESVEELTKLPGIAFAFSSLALARGGVADTLMTKAVLRNYHAKRSGDVYVVFEPQHFINDFDGLTVAVTQGSPWRYDTHVPVLFAGGGIKAARVSRPVTPYDIAATLAAVVGAKPPSGLVGSPLAEVLAAD